MPEYIQIALKKAFLSKYSLPNINYPIPTASIKQVLDSYEDVCLQDILYWLQVYSASLKKDWESLEPALLRLSEIVATGDDESEGNIYTSEFYLNIRQIDIRSEVITINRGEKILVAIQPYLNFTLSISVFHPIDAKAISYLIDLGRIPHPDYGVDMRENNWEYALDMAAPKASSMYAKERGESHLSYWKNGLTLSKKDMIKMDLNQYLTMEQMKPNIVSAQIGTFYERMEEKY